MMMQDSNNTMQQNKSGTCPAHQPNDSTQAGNQSVVECNQSEGECTKEDTAKSHSDSIDLQPLIPDKDYPAGVREWMMTAPSELKFSTLAVSSSMLAVYATRIRLNYVYDNSLSAILLHVLVCGDQSSGKSFARYLMRYLMDPFIKRDTEQRAEEQKYAELKRRQGKKDGKLPPEPKTDITLLHENLSLSMLIKRADAPMKLFGTPKTLFQFADEIGAIVQASKRQFSDIKQINKTGYDLGSEFGQDYLSEASYSAVVDLMLCYVYTGTPAAVNRYMDKAAIEGGSVTRTILCNVNSQLGENPLIFKPLTEEQKQSIDTTLQKLMSLCYSEDGKSLRKESLLDTSWLDPTVKKWCEARRSDVMKSMSKALDVFYKRSSVSAFRIASLMQYLYQVEGVKTQKEIRRLVKQIYLACADRILHNMLGKWGAIYDEINADFESHPYKTCNYFDELPQEFSRKFLEEFLTRKGVRTPLKNVICNWKRKGWIEKLATGSLRKKASRAISSSKKKK